MGVSLPTMQVPSVLSGGGTTTLQSYLTSLTPTLGTHFTETSGDAVNYGSDGIAGTVAGCTQAQTGQLGASEAYLFDGADDSVSFAAASVPATFALTTQRWFFLVNASGLGEGNSGALFAFGNGANTRLYFASTNRLTCGINTDATDAAATTDNNQVDFLNAWTLVFMDYDDGNALGLGRKIRLMRATAASATTLLTLATDTAATGTIATLGATLGIGNNSAGAVTFAGLMDEAFAGPGLWSPAGAPADLTMCDTIRSLAFGV